MKEKLSKWKVILCSQVGRFNIVKMAVLPQNNLQIQFSPSHNPNSLFVQMEKLILKFYGIARKSK